MASSVALTKGRTVKQREAGPGGGSTPRHPSVEPCSICGEETAVGSPLFSDRRELERDGQRAYLCSICLENAVGVRRGTHLSGAELERAINVAALAGQVWGGRPS